MAAVFATIPTTGARGAEADTTSKMDPPTSQQPQQQQRQIPIVCPGHTRPLAELQFCRVDDPAEERRCLLMSACHGTHGARRGWLCFCSLKRAVLKDCERKGCC
jgi:hypothetical protein